MGAVTFSIDLQLIELVKKQLLLTDFVETGTFKGDTTAACAEYFDRLHTIELSEELYLECKKRFSNQPKITIYQDESSYRLEKLKDNLSNESVLYWLDAHWCVASNTAGHKSQCPLLNEIKAIGNLNQQSIIIIDDARLFLCPPSAPHEVSHWPKFHEIIENLFKISSNHKITIINDCIIYYPSQIEALINQYAHENGIDWLNVMDIFYENKKYNNIINEKEQQIQLLSNALNSQNNSLLEKEAAIHRLSNELIARTNSLSALQIEFHSIAAKAKNLDELLIEKRAEHLNLNKFLATKEEKIQLLSTSLNAVQQSLEEKELFIQIQNKFIPQNNYFRIFLLKFTLKISSYFIKKLKNSIFISLLKKPAHQFKTIFKKKYGPFLGVLDQYPPKHLILPKSYYQSITINNPLKISIVTPSYQQGNFIEKTLKSVLDQNYPYLEYFVQDGGSKDETVKILQNYEHQLSGWESKPDKGQSHAINLGFAHTTGEIMAWLNSDDLLLPGTLAYVADYFAKHPDVDVIYGNRIIIDENDMEIGRWVMPRNDYAVLSWADFIPQETLFWRRSIWEKAGGKIDESFQFAMDWDLLVRLRDAGAGINRLPRFLGAFRVHTQQKTSMSIEEIGTKDMQKIRTRCNGLEPTNLEISENIKNYLWWHVIEHNFRLIHYKR